jgi:hypothetical protein
MYFIILLLRVARGIVGCDHGRRLCGQPARHGTGEPRGGATRRPRSTPPRPGHPPQRLQPAGCVAPRACRVRCACVAPHVAPTHPHWCTADKESWARLPPTHEVDAVVVTFPCTPLECVCLVPRFGPPVPSVARVRSGGGHSVPCCARSDLPLRVGDSLARCAPPGL